MVGVVGRHIWGSGDEWRQGRAGALAKWKAQGVGWYVLVGSGSFVRMRVRQVSLARGRMRPRGWREVGRAAVSCAIVGDMCVGGIVLLGRMRSHIERGQAGKHAKRGRLSIERTMEKDCDATALVAASPTKLAGPLSPGAQSANVGSPGTPAAGRAPPSEAVVACATSPPVGLEKSPGTPASALAPLAPVVASALVVRGGAGAPLALDDLATGLQQSEVQPSGCGEFQCSRCMEMCPISQLLGNKKDDPGPKAIELICNSNYKALARRWKKDLQSNHRHPPYPPPPPPPHPKSGQVVAPAISEALCGCAPSLLATVARRRCRTRWVPGGAHLHRR